MHALYNACMSSFAETVDSLMDTLDRLYRGEHNHEDVRLLADVAVLKIAIAGTYDGARTALGERIRSGQVNPMMYYPVLERASNTGYSLEVRRGHHSWMALVVRSLPEDWVFSESMEPTEAETVGYHVLDAWSNGLLTDAQVIPVLQRETRWWDLGVNRGLTRMNKDWFWRLDRLLPLNSLGPQHAWCLGRLRQWAVGDMDPAAADLWNMAATYHPDYADRLIRALDLLAGVGLTYGDGKAFEEILLTTMGHTMAPMELIADHAVLYGVEVS